MNGLYCTGKSEVMILKANGFIGPLRPIMFGNALKKYVTNSTSLEIVTDNRLTWTKHHEKVMKSFSAKLKNLRSQLRIEVRPTENDLTQLYKNGDISVVIMCS